MTFSHWLHQRHVPDADRLFALIQAFGPNGISEKELRGSVDLPHYLFVGLLRALLGAGVVKMIELSGNRFYVSC